MSLHSHIFICKCYSPEHQLMIWYDSEENEYYFTVHLTPENNFFKRLWKALKYIFGHKCNYGHFDEFLLRDEDRKKLLDFLNN